MGACINQSSKESVPKNIGNQPTSEGFDLRKINWQKAAEIGLFNHVMSKHGSTPTCGKLLSHCKSKVTSLREKLGIRICIFKIGVTATPISRYEMYMEKGYRLMWLIAETSSVDLVHMCEAALVSEYHKHVGCKNAEGTGGDGALNRTPPAPPPYFVYVVGGKADEGRWVG